MTKKYENKVCKIARPTSPVLPILVVTAGHFVAKIGQIKKKNSPNT